MIFNCYHILYSGITNLYGNYLYKNRLNLLQNYFEYFFKRFQAFKKMFPVNMHFLTFCFIYHIYMKFHMGGMLFLWLWLGFALVYIII